MRRPVRRRMRDAPSNPVEHSGGDKAVDIGHNRSWDAAFLWLAVLLIIIHASYFVYYFQIVRLPEPVPEALAGKRGFSEELAYHHARFLSYLGPHPVGSAALDKAMQYVLQKVEVVQAEASLGVDVGVDLFKAKAGVNDLVGGLFKGKSLVYTNLVQLAVRVKSASMPDAEDNAILVSSHVDTVITAPGAGDCNSNVAVMLELLRATSHWGHGFKHSIIFLFNTGEEEGLDGAHAFITQHPWRSSIRTFVDLEAMGVGGKSILFQAGPNKAIVELYAKVVKHPAAQITSYDVFHSGFVKSATDFQVYKEIGNLSGLDFAFMKNGAVYHTKNDKLQLLTPGSLQHIGDNMLALLCELAVYDDLPNISVAHDDEGKPWTKIVYFDILGRYLITYAQSFAKQLYVSVITQALLLLIVSLLQGGSVSVKALALAIVGIICAWLLSIGLSVTMALLLPHLSIAAIPYIPYPWLIVGLFGAPALFGALVGNHFGFVVLKKFLLKALQAKYEMWSKSSGQSYESLASWDTQRWLYKAGFIQWLALLSIGVWSGVGSSYIALIWLVSPALAYGIIDATFSPHRTPCQMRVTTLIAAIAVPLVATGGTVILLFDAMVGILVRLDRNPGMSPEWVGNMLIAVLTAAAVCLFLVYLFPYAHLSGALTWILSALAIIFGISLLIVSFGVLPPFTQHFGRALNVVEVVEMGISETGESVSSSYVLVYSLTPGKLRQEASFLKDQGLKCGAFEGIDMVTHTVKYGCFSVSDQHRRADSYLKEGPSIVKTSETVVNSDRLASFNMQLAPARRWVLGINATYVQSFQIEEVTSSGSKTLLAPRRNLSSVDGWHTIQFVTNQEGPSTFELSLFWNDFESLDDIINAEGGGTYRLLKLRTDVHIITPKVEKVLQVLPEWTALFGKSTAPYLLSYLVTYPPASLIW